ncbi:MAG: excinuclease ABC subunit UvrC [Angustibacter sp.]
MADPATYRPEPGQIPGGPGVYRFRDARGRVIYVGKAKNLRARLSSYFQDPSALHPRTRSMVFSAARVEWTVVSTEVEALQLEYSWIKEFDPRFNVKYRDDKSYPYLAVTMGEEYPRIQVMRGAKRRGTRYFGPYAHAWAIRETVDLLLRVFPVRTCSAGVFRRARGIGRPCLLGYIGKCSAPCVERVSVEEHRQLSEDFCDFMAGQTSRFVKRLEDQMRTAAAELDYERAARLRDDVGALRRALEKSAVVLGDATDADVFSLAQDDLEAAVQVFHVRAGRVRGQRGWVVEKVEDVGTEELVEHLLQQVYGAAPEAVPREVLVPALPSAPKELIEWLGQLRGGNVDLRVPQRGDKRALLDTVGRNAQQALALHKTKRAGDLTARSQALKELQDILDLPEAPLRIESFDVSNLQGTDVVASMVVFEDGLPRKSEYRRFAIRGVDGQDDVRSMREVIARRFRRLVNEQARQADGEAVAAISGTDPDTGRPAKFAYPPQLVVVDGGPGQVAAAADALADVGINRGPIQVSLVGLAKRLEEVWLPDQEHPVVLPRTSQGLYLLQRVRDEAHRFAIAYHRQRRSRSMTTSVLDDVPGLGATRRAALLGHFGSVRRLRAASVGEVAAVPGIGPTTAQAVLDALTATSTTAVNTATGEVLDE